MKEKEFIKSDDILECKEKFITIIAENNWKNNSSSRTIGWAGVGVFTESNSLANNQN